MAHCAGLLVCGVKALVRIEQKPEKIWPAPHSSSVLILCKIGLSCQTGQRPNFCTVPDDEGYPAMLFLHGENKVQLWWSPFLANLVRGKARLGETEMRRSLYCLEWQFSTCV